jgi:hypothetical protein
LSRAGMWSIVVKMAVKCAWLILNHRQQNVGGMNGRRYYMYSIGINNRRMKMERQDSPTASFPKVSYRVTLIFL